MGGFKVWAWGLSKFEDGDFQSLSMGDFQSLSMGIFKV
jgi:hypothetical protein